MRIIKVKELTKEDTWFHGVLDGAGNVSGYQCGFDW
jgi:hypothetical protein